MMNEYEEKLMNGEYDELSDDLNYYDDPDRNVMWSNPQDGLWGDRQEW